MTTVTSLLFLFSQLLVLITFQSRVLGLISNQFVSGFTEGCLFLLKIGGSDSEVAEPLAGIKSLSNSLFATEHCRMKSTGLEAKC